MQHYLQQQQQRQLQLEEDEGGPYNAAVDTQQQQRQLQLEEDEGDEEVEAVTYNAAVAVDMQQKQQQRELQLEEDEDDEEVEAGRGGQSEKEDADRNPSSVIVCGQRSVKVS